MQDAFDERKYSIRELSKLLGLGVEKTRLLFRGEPGVLKITAGAATGKRRRTTYRIPESVARRVQERLTIPAAASRE